MATKGPYFIWDTKTGKVIGTDGKLHDKDQAMSQGILCAFRSVNAAGKFKNKAQDKGLQVISQNTMRNHYRVTVEDWQAMLKTFHDGVDPAWKPDLVYDGKGGMVKPEEPVSAPVKKAAPKKKEPSSIPPVPTSPAEKPGVVYASPAALSEIWSNPLIADTIDLLERASVLAQRWDAESAELDARLSKVDASLGDELHFVEFMELDGRRAYNSYKRIHSLRIERRQIKNAQTILAILNDSMKMTPGRMSDALQMALNCIDGLQNRKYTPRITWPSEDDLVNGCHHS